MSISIVSPGIERFEEISGFVSKYNVLNDHGIFFYRIVLDYFGDTALIATDGDDRICGWTFGFASQREPELFFLYQIGVDPRHLRKGIGTSLIEALIGRASGKGCSRMRATVEPDNIASRRLFEKAGFKNISGTLSGSFRHLVYECPYIPDFYGPDDNMIVFEREIHP